MLLNITNGDAFNEHLAKQTADHCIPFREAMMQGVTTSDIFSDDFISLRASELSISKQEYSENIKILRDEIKNYNEIRLSFGTDTFCQMNLLTLLAFLEDISYLGEIKLDLIDDESFEIINSNIPVVLGIYKKLYDAILVRKEVVSASGVISQRAVDLYFDYLSDNGMLANIIKEYSNEDQNALLLRLLRESREYGLSDIQAKELISKYL